MKLSERNRKNQIGSQPPSGGCVLKPRSAGVRAAEKSQPPSGGCVLKQIRYSVYKNPAAQPPSGGCVLKQLEPWPASQNETPAAFRRLCVETCLICLNNHACDPAAFRRLCVETDGLEKTPPPNWSQPPSGGCVLKLKSPGMASAEKLQPPSGGCVLKQV